MVNIVLPVVIIIGLIWLLFWLIPEFCREVVVPSWIARYRAQQWCNPPKGKGDEEDEKEEWVFIKNVLLLKSDPLIISKSTRKAIRKESTRFLFCIAALSVIVIFLVNKIAGALGPAFIATYEPLFTPLVILVSALLVARGTRNTIRVNGRASSRQDWIKEVRVILAELASSMPTPDLDEALRQCQRSKSEHKFRELELHLNPSEKMHRSLLYAINLAYDADWLKDDEVEKNLRLGNTEDRHDGKLQAGIIRLSQVVLKQEWEQTKKLR